MPGLLEGTVSAGVHSFKFGNNTEITNQAISVTVSFCGSLLTSDLPSMSLSKVSGSVESLLESH